MADTDAPAGASTVDMGKFGTCCAELKDALSGDEFEPLIALGEDGVLYMSVGLIDLEDEEPGMVEHPMFYCPFCGTQVQTEDEVKSKAEAGA